MDVEDRELLPCPAENQNCTLGALSAALIFAQATLEEIGLSFPDARESREQQQHSTISGNETRSELQDETHSHEILIHSRFGIAETADDVISHD